ncbi:MAG TPA: T9SS type A sorting domain-containing protein, partial [Rhodothermales bacterium]|nr:T9SS type A sorting domain-containing protein [Rhodothermales bacterium]
AWAAYDETAMTYLLGRSLLGFGCPYEKPSVPPGDVEAARNEAISYAAYRMLQHRFRNSPSAEKTLARFDSLMGVLGYDQANTLSSHASGSPAELGNYIALCMIGFGLQDGSNEQLGYTNLSYEPVNPALAPIIPGDTMIVDRNRWQPLTLRVFIDQAGNVIPISTPAFLGPEWGLVVPFSLSKSDLSIYERHDFPYWVYHDPGPPPYLDLENTDGLDDPYKWTFALVAAWSSHLDPSDGVMWDISPGALGNNPEFPASFADYPQFYDLINGGNPGQGYALNPVTGLPYEPQIVPRGDFTRVLAEFWADGPASETPPGHWFTILNYVSDHPLSHRRFRGEGPELDPLEWDVKAYIALGGAMHDVAVSVWGIKGWYDYIRPISAIRCLADRGQSSDPDGPSYQPDGMPLVDGVIELVGADDPLAGDSLQHVGKVKVKSWRGPDYVEDPDTSVAGVGWILAESWWPYQRPSFVTPPFAGYISGHSTFSRAAAEVLTRLTGDPYFPGGLAEFQAPKNEFLVFEDGPSVDVTLQWAMYKDASDQSSLSRIWGGIHPPADDIPGRIVGEKIGTDAFLYAERFFGGLSTSTDSDRLPRSSALAAFPNPVLSGGTVTLDLSGEPGAITLSVVDVTGRVVDQTSVEGGGLVRLRTDGLASGVYFVRAAHRQSEQVTKIVVM